MAIKTILDLLNQKPYVSTDEIEKALSCSKRQVGKYISYLRSVENRHGFSLVTIKTQGYQLLIHDQEKYRLFEEKLDSELPDRLFKKQHRLLLIMYLLLKDKNFITIEQISKVIDVSKNTIMTDLDDVRKTVKEFNIELVSKKHYGIKLEGNERDIRLLFSKITTELIETKYYTEQLFFFSKEFDNIFARSDLLNLLKLNDFQLNDNMIDSLLMHIQILIHRITQENFINEISIKKELIDHHSYRLARSIISRIQDQTQIDVPKSEIDLLASQIVGKSPSSSVPLELRDDYILKIINALKMVDRDYSTNYSQDETLIEYLLLHIYPLLKRVAFQLELKNSLIESVSAQYANQFIVAMRFIEYHSDLCKYPLSRDEIGYIALHFAAHQERMNQFGFRKIEKILLVGDFRQSNLLLAKSKINVHFPNAKVTARTNSSLKDVMIEDVDLVLVTEEISLPEISVVWVQVSEAFTEEDFMRIRNVLLLNQDLIQNRPIRGIVDLFFKDLFFIDDTSNYKDILQKYAQILVDKKYADEGYISSVLEREERFSTVYENGVAGPHGMDQKALIDSIAVILLRGNVEYRDKPVKLIFLINIKQGHLFIHQEISDLLLKIMVDVSLVNRLCQINNFLEFKMYLEKIK